MKNDPFSSFQENRTKQPESLPGGQSPGSDPFENFQAAMDAVIAGEIEVDSAEQLVDPVIWQRLVDGQLTHEQYLDILMFAELRPELWRPCALAFLQEQVLKSAISPLKGLRAKDSAAEPKSEPPKKEASTRSVVSTAGKSLAVALSSLAAGFLLTISLTTTTSPSGSSGPILATPVVAETNGFFQPKGCVKPIGTHISRRAISSEQFRKRGLKFSSEVPRTPVEISAEFDENEWNATRRFYVFRDQDGAIYYQPIDRFEINPKSSH